MTRQPISLLGHKKQSGSVLLISLTILVILTLVTFSSSRNVLLQQKMAISLNDSTAVTEAAELAMIEAESVAMGGTYGIPGDTTITGGVNGFFRGDNCDVSIANCYVNTELDFFNPNTWSSKSATATQSYTMADGSTITGQYKVIYLGLRSIALNQNNNFRVIDAGYQSQSEQSFGGTHVFKVISTAEYNDIRKVFVSYFASVSGVTQPTLL